MKKSKPSLSKLRPKVPSRLQKVRVPNPLRRRGAEPDNKLVEALQNLPRITNETVAEHREEVIGSARKYIMPLGHSKKRVVNITVSLVVLAFIGFFAYCLAALYHFQSTSTFIYGITQVVPFPVAKAGPSWVSYESYLFELRHTIHYYENEGQPKENFHTKAGKQHLAQLKKQAMAQVIQDAYVKQLARKNHVSVSSSEVSNAVSMLRQQNRLGSNDRVYRDVLSEFWGWTPQDFERELKQQLLTQNVASQLDTTTHQRAQSVLDQLNKGSDFAQLAMQNSDDPVSKANGGEYGETLDQNSSDVSPTIANELSKLQPGQHSGIIENGTTLEIVKVISRDGTKVRAAHIVFNLKPISDDIAPLQKAKPARKYISV